MDHLPNGANDFRIQVKLNYDDGAAAKAGLNAVKFGIAMGKIGLSSSMPKNLDAETKKMIQAVNKQLDAVKSEVVESDVQLTYEANTTDYLPMLMAAIVKVRRAADTMLSSNNMRLLMIAMHNYHNDYNAMPPSMSMKNGKPLHSWRVMLLPYLELDNVAKQLRMDEPWNSEHNLKIFESMPMPKVFHHPAHKDDTSRKTYYKVFFSKPGSKPSADFSLVGKSLWDN